MALEIINFLKNKIITPTLQICCFNWKQNLESNDHTWNSYFGRWFINLLIKITRFWTYAMHGFVIASNYKVNFSLYKNIMFNFL